MMYPYGNGPMQQIIRVNGENGARAFQMMPNSSCLLLDETNPIVWLVQTDGAGYKTTTPYKIEPYTPAPQPDMQDIINRLNKLEERLNGQSNSEQAKRQPKQHYTE